MKKGLPNMKNESIESFLEKYDLWFSVYKKELLEKEKKNQALLQQFLDRFTSSYVKTMGIDDYIVGKGGDSFCKWVETDLQSYGDIHAKKLNAWAKFGIYYNSKESRYEYGARFGRDEVTVFNSLRKEVLSLMEAAKVQDYDVLAKSKLNPLFKNKIFFLYNQSASLPIYSDSDLRVLLAIFDIKCSGDIDRAYKRKLLFEFYKSLNRPDITTFRFMQFVYNDMGYRPVLRTAEAHELVKEIRPKSYSLVDVKSLEDILSPSSSSTRSGLVNEKPESVVQKKLTGKKGEEIVKSYLLTHKKELDIVGEPEFFCDKNDFVHHDISYKDSSGRTIYIEVKATKANTSGKVHFEMSDKEYDFMMEHLDNYYFFYINDVFNGDVIQRIPASCIQARPSKYRITMKIKD